MCLKTVNYDGVEGYGYKMFRKSGIRIKSFHRKSRINKTTWNVAGLGKIYSNEYDYETDKYKKYPAGFHLYLSIDTAKNKVIENSGSVLYKVAFKEILAIGNDVTDPNRQTSTVVARQIKLIEQISV